LIEVCRLTLQLCKLHFGMSQQLSMGHPSDALAFVMFILSIYSEFGLH